MAKVKKMGLGGFFGGLLGGGAKHIAKAVSKSPVTKALAGGVGAVKPGAALAGVATPKSISNKLPGRTPVGIAAGTKSIGSAVRGAGSMAKPIASVGRAAMGALGGGRVMKKGGKVGKSKAMAVKMAKGGRTCK